MWSEKLHWGVPHHKILKCKNTMKKKHTIKKTALNKRNSKILHETMVTLGALKEGSAALQEMRINEIQVHILDENGDGVVLCLEYETSETGVEQLNKTFSTMEEYYTDEENENENDDALVPLSIGEIDACASPENVKEFLKARIEETISEEYDEIFHDSNKKPPPLLN